MIAPALSTTLRLRLPATLFAALGLIAMTAAVGALFPAVGHSIGKLTIPKGVSALLGGADYGTVTGWFQSEIASVYGPLVAGGMAIAGAVAATAGEEEDGILALVLAYPIRRSHLLIAKALAIGVVVAVVAIAAWLGMLIGVALAGGGISLAHVSAFALQLACFGFATGAFAIAVAAGTGRRSIAIGAAAGVAIAGWLINGFAPLAGAVAWLKYLSFFFYYAGHDPLTRGVDLVGVVVLCGATLALTALGMAGIDRRDLRG